MNRSELQLRIDELADEFLQRRYDGENPTIEEFANANPDISTPLKRYLRTILMVDDIRDDSEFKTNPRFNPTSHQDGFPKLDDYEVIREIGRGGMGIVYEAHHLSLDRTVALKVLPAGMFQNQGAVKRFQLEAKSAARLHHTNIVPIFDVDQKDDICFYAMQFIEGQSLDYVVNELGKMVGESKNGKSADEKDSALSDTMKLGLSSTTAGRKPFYRNVARLGKQASEALHHAHENGIVHRDIKPANLMLDFNGTIWIMDFGLAKTDESNLTQTGDVVGTLRYMSPERFAGQCDRRSDVYSLGMTMYELLSQRPAFGDTNRLSLIDSIKTSEPRQLRKIDHNIPRDLETIVEKAIEKDPRRRYLTAGEMSADLSRFISGRPIHARRVGNVEKLWLWAKKRKALAASLAALGTLLTVGTVASTVAATYYRDLADRNLVLAQSNSEKTTEADSARKDAEEKRKLAEQRAVQADTARGKAETSQNRTNDVFDLVINAFGAVDPNAGANADMLARDVLLNIEESLKSSTLDEQGRLQLLDELTRCYLAIGEEKSALSAAQQYLELSEDFLGANDMQTIGARELLAQVYKLSGRLKEALQLFELNIEAMKAQPDWKEEDSIIPVGNLANAYYTAGLRTEALALHEKNVPLAKQVFGKDGPIYLSLLKARALCYQELGQLDKAIAQFEEALETGREVEGEDHPNTLHAMNSLAVAYSRNKETEKAIALYEEVQRLMKSKLGENHPDTLNVMGNLVRSYTRSRQIDKAIELGERTIELVREKFGNEHPANFGPMSSLAFAYLTGLRYAEAIEMYENLASLQESKLGPNHPNTLIARSNLAVAYGKVERQAEALEIQEENFRRTRSSLGGRTSKDN